MGLRVKRLSEDIVDTYTHIWSLALFLLLTIILLTVPDIQQSVTTRGEQAGDHPNPSKQPSSTPRFTVNCWCPSQFEQSQIDYTNEVCSRIYSNSKKKKTHSSQRGGSLVNHFPFPLDLNHPESTKAKNSNPAPKEDSKNENDFSTKENRFQRPVVLFIMSIALILPRMLCSILSKCFACVNVEKTLESAQKIDATTNHEERRQRYTDLVKAITDSTQTSGKTTTYLYLVMKTLVILVLVVEIVLVVVVILPLLQDTSSVSKATPEADAVTTNDTYTTTTTIPDYQDPRMSFSKQLNDDSPVFHCYFKIRTMQNVHDYTVQCIISGLITELQLQDTKSALPDTIFMIVLANLIILLVVQIISTFVWFASLTSDSTRLRLGLSKDSSLDMVFLVSMARANLGVGVSCGLIRALGERDQDSSKGDDHDGGYLLKKV